LKQYKTATEYTIKFQQYSDYSGWNDWSLANQYYTSLKEFVKDKLTRIDRPTTLSEIIKETVKINNRFLERSLEKKGSYNFGRKYNGGGKKYRDLIKLDAAYKKP
jgi:hypothetical protein